MGAEKTNALVLQVLPYRESSCLLRLFTQRHGLVHGVAKGIRRAKSRQDSIERGALVEIIVHLRPQRELHTVSGVHILDFFPAIRAGILKSALRDAAFEAVLSAVTETDVHPELYDLLVRFLRHVQSSSEPEACPFALWLFYYRFAQCMGVAPNLTRCVSCGSAAPQRCMLHLKKGGLVCGGCAENSAGAYEFPPAAASFLVRGAPKPDALRAAIPADGLRRVTRVLADYCRYHFNVQKEYRSLVFLEEMAGWERG